MKILQLIKMKQNIAIIIRVFDRISDLDFCINAIKTFWQHNNYYIIVISNGKKQGYNISNFSKSHVDKYIELPENAGHLHGNSQLLLEGIKHIPADCKYSIILEADTWIFQDNLIKKYTQIMEKSKIVWASSEWIEKYYTLGLDFAIIDSSFIINNSEIFNFTVHAEAFIYNYLEKYKFKNIYIKENMPVHIPSFLRKFYNPSGGRFRAFLKSKMVTHHIEDLKNGIAEKQEIANAILGYRHFNVGSENDMKKIRCELKVINFLLPFIPKSKWFKKKRRRNI